ncbi:hypothetical protein AC229_1454 [Oenococcus oeni]|nr:hypothetical protein AC229_1454 [Oenococcus oeni]
MESYSGVFLNSSKANYKQKISNYDFLNYIKIFEYTNQHFNN